MIAFVENKFPNMTRVAELLESCYSVNMWANRGPLYHQLAEAYTLHFSLDDARALTPCANGGIALEAMARLLGMEAGRPLRWVASAFSFQNLGRGYFADVTFVDVTPSGMLDLDEVRLLDPNTFDGIIVVNPFGLGGSFAEYAAYAEESGKKLLIDNAAGIGPVIPDWPWQSFSLHHTKPYGAGEGGLALTPSGVAEELYGLISYGECPSDRAAWLNNGKLSDIACAFQIDRLERASEWAPRYHEQAARLSGIAEFLGLRPLLPLSDTTPLMSMPLLSDQIIPFERLGAPGAIRFGKYYKPLADLQRTTRLFDHLVNVPTHPDVERLTDDEVEAAIASLLE